MKDVMICVDTDHDPDGSAGAPIFDGPRDQPIWALYEVLDDDGSDVWPVKFHAKGLTYKQAEDLADVLGTEWTADLLMFFNADQAQGAIGATSTTPSPEGAQRHINGEQFPGKGMKPGGAPAEGAGAGAAEGGAAAAGGEAAAAGGASLAELAPLALLA